MRLSLVRLGAARGLDLTAVRVLRVIYGRCLRRGRDNGVEIAVRVADGWFAESRQLHLHIVVTGRKELSGWLEVLRPVVLERVISVELFEVPLASVEPSLLDSIFVLKGVQTADDLRYGGLGIVVADSARLLEVTPESIN